MAKLDKSDIEALITMDTPLGKRIGPIIYINVSALEYMTDTDRTLLVSALDIYHSEDPLDYNVVKINRYKKTVSLLTYKSFFSDPFPSLHKAITINLSTCSSKLRYYSASKNPPILHRKELLLPYDHPKRSLFEQLTYSLDNLGVKADQPNLGFRKQWDAYLLKNGIQIYDHMIRQGNQI